MITSSSIYPESQPRWSSTPCFRQTQQVSTPESCHLTEWGGRRRAAPCPCRVRLIRTAPTPLWAAALPASWLLRTGSTHPINIRPLLRRHHPPYRRLRSTTPNNRPPSRCPLLHPPPPLILPQRTLSPSLLYWRSLLRKSKVRRMGNDLVSFEVDQWSDNKQFF